MSVVYTVTVRGNTMLYLTRSRRWKTSARVK